MSDKCASVAGTSSGIGTAFLVPLWTTTSVGASGKKESEPEGTSRNRSPVERKRSCVHRIVQDQARRCSGHREARTRNGNSLGQESA